MSKGKKSITASFGLLTSGIEADASLPETDGGAAALPPALPRVGAGVIGAAQRSIGELRDERDRLKALLESGQGASNALDPLLIDPSPFPDRLSDDADGDYLAFRQSVEAEGQKIPIQVRPHPASPGRYQVIYGHRRLRAARDLGVPVKALVLDMTDRDLVVSQGLENAARQDLTWIERALFARRMDDAGIRAKDIRAALSIDDPELARMRSVYRAVPEGLIERIGRAPKVGRPRWVEFGRLYAETPDAGDRIATALSGDKDSARASDERFRLAFDALKAKTPEIATSAGTLELREPDGEALGSLKVSKKDLRLVATTARGRSFSAFLQSEMPALIARFHAENTEK